MHSSSLREACWATVGCQVLAEAVQSLSPFTEHPLSVHLPATCKGKARIFFSRLCGGLFCRKAQCQSDAAHQLACQVVQLLTVAMPTASWHPRALHPLQTKFLSLDDGMAGYAWKASKPQTHSSTTVCALSSGQKTTWVLLCAWSLPE